MTQSSLPFAFTYQLFSSPPVDIPKTHTPTVSFRNPLRQYGPDQGDFCTMQEGGTSRSCDLCHRWIPHRRRDSRNHAGDASWRRWYFRLRYLRCPVSDVLQTSLNLVFRSQIPSQTAPPSKSLTMLPSRMESQSPRPYRRFERPESGASTYLFSSWDTITLYCATERKIC
jgi:hypothetical protein